MQQNTTGQWVNGLREGFAVEYLPNGDSFSGIFKEGKRNGNGIYYFSDGTQFEGMWVNGRKCGFGVFKDGNDYITEIHKC